MALADSFDSKTVDQWLLLAIVRSDNPIDKAGIKKLLDGHFKFSETSFIKAKNFLVANRLVRAQGSKGQPAFFTPNLEIVVREIIGRDAKSLSKSDYQKLKAFFSDSTTRKIFFDPEVSSSKEAPFIFSCAMAIQYAINVSAHAQLKGEESKKVTEAQEILLRLSPDALSSAKVLKNNFSKYLPTVGEQIEYWTKAKRVGDIVKRMMERAMK